MATAVRSVVARARQVRLELDQRRGLDLGTNLPHYVVHKAKLKNR